MTYPTGAEVTYAYQYVDFERTPVSDAFQFPELTASLATKILTNPDGTDGTWTYEFKPQSVRSSDPRYGSYYKDETRITTPNGIEVYEHYGKWFELQTNGVYLHIRPSFVGLLEQKRTYSLSNQLLEVMYYAWELQKISDENFWHGSEHRNTWWREDASYLPILIGQYRKRGSALTTSGYSARVEYFNHDRFGRPLSQIEYINRAGEPNKRTRFRYKHDTNKWIIGLVEEEIVEALGVGDSSNSKVIGKIIRKYDDNGNLTSENTYGIKIGYTYSTEGDVKTATDALGRTTQYLDYRRGIAQREEYIDGTFIKRKVNNNGLVVEQTNEEAHTTHFKYDDLNRIENITYPIKAPVVINYTKNTRTLTRGTYQQVDTFDGLGQMINSTKGPLAFTTAYDALGQVIFESYPSSTQGMHFKFDALGRVVREEHADGEFKQYDYNDFITTVTDERGYQTQYSYNQFGLDEENKAIYSIISPENVGTLFSRNIFNQPESIVQGRFRNNRVSGPQRRFSYDQHFYLVEKFDGEVGTTTYINDALGQTRRTFVNDLPEITFHYDKRNRLALVDYPDTTPDVAYKYYSDGLVERVSRGDVAWNYSYDENNNLLNETLNITGTVDLTLPLSYTINPLDHVADVTYPNGLTVDYAPDALGRPTQVGSFAHTVGFHPSGQLHTYTAANNLVTTITLNDRLFPATITAGNSVDLTYSYDAAGNVTQISNAVETAQSLSMLDTNSYDGLHRLRRVSGSWGNGTFDYDFNDNIENKNLGEEHYYYYAGQRLNSITFGNGRRSHQYSYDQQGNVNHKQTVVRGLNGQRQVTDRYYTYNRANELSYANVEDVKRLYTYDSAGMRVIARREKGYDITYSVYSGMGELMYEHSLLECKTTVHLHLFNLTIGTLDKGEGDASIDEDGDQIPDCLETLLGLDPTNANDALADSDNDGLSNLQEILAGTSITRVDTDNDGVEDGEEVNNLNTHPLLRDSDFDGLSDGYEVTMGFDPNSGSDGLADNDDDGLINMLEENYGSNALLADSDGDGLSDAFENTYWFSPEDNDAQATADSDNDGLSDLEEQNLGTSPIHHDSDNDGLSDHEETSLYMTNPTVADSDGDGVDDGREVLYDGTDPNDPLSFFTEQQEITLSSTLPYDMTDGDGFTWSIINRGAGLQWQIPDIAENQLFAALDYFPSPDRPFDGTIRSSNTHKTAFLEDNGREFVTPEATLEYIDFPYRYRLGYTRKYYVSENKSFVRILDIYTNVGEEVVSFSSDNMGFFKYQENTEYVVEASSSGDKVLAAHDDFVVLEARGIQDTQAHYSVLAFGDARDNKVDKPHDAISYAGEDIRVAYTGFTTDLLPGETKIFMHMVSRHNERDAALTAAKNMVRIDEEELFGMTLFERQHVVNFDLVNYLDSDNDDLKDIYENQAGTNITLVDTDSDGMSDFYEVRQGLDPLFNDGAADPDNDGLTNLEEFQARTDAQARDTDQDGLSDFDEVREYGTNPLAEDSDNDGMDDAFELLINNSDPLQPDTGDALPPHEDTRGEFSLRATNQQQWVSTSRGWFANSPSQTELSDVTNDNYGTDIFYRQSNNRELVLTSKYANNQGIIFTRKMYLDEERQFIRIREIFHNTSDRVATVNPLIQVNSQIPDSDVLDSSNNDNVLTIDDRYGILGSDNPDAPAEAYVIRDMSSDALKPNALEKQVDTNYPDRSYMHYNYGFSIPAGSTRTLMHFIAYGDTLEQTRRHAQSISRLSAEHVKGMTLRERRDVINFDADFIDNDGDGLADSYEQQLGTNAFAKDSDNDQLPDDFELRYGFNPTVAGEQLEDPDNDGLTTLVEQQLGSNPTLADTDRDTLSDGDEVNIYNTSPINADTDNGGARDHIEIQQDLSDPLNPNDDRAELTQWSGNSPNIRNANGEPWSIRTLRGKWRGGYINNSTGKFYPFEYRNSSTSTPGFVENNRREFQSITHSQSGIEAYRKTFVSEALNVLRHVDFFTNTSTQEITIKVWLDTSVYQLVTSSDGNRHISIDDHYLIFNNGYYLNGYVFAGKGFNTLRPSVSSSDGGRFIYSLTIAPGETQALMHIYLRSDDGTELQGTVDKVLALNPAVYESLNNQERAQVVNFDLVDTEDTDGDGLRDQWEMAQGLMPDHQDSDGDTLRDGFEIRYGLDPLEVNLLTTDEDGDGLSVLQEQEQGTSSIQADSDNDGLNDNDELNLYATDPANAYSDSGLLHDGHEVLRLNTNPNDGSDDMDENIRRDYLSLGTPWLARGRNGLDFASNTSTVLIGDNPNNTRYAASSYPGTWSEPYFVSIHTDNRELEWPTVRMDKVEHRRRVYVPTSGSFGRILDTFTNPLPQAQTLTVTLSLTRQGAAANYTIESTASGDATLTAEDTHFISRPNSYEFLVHHYGQGDTTQSGIQGYDLANQSLAVDYTLTIPPGQTRSIMQFFAYAGTLAEATTLQTALVPLTPEHLEGMTTQEQAQVINFSLPLQ